MRAFCVVEAPPLLNQDLGFNEGVKDLSIEKLVSHAAVE